mmetsp:Transcript_7954/g.29416  ORF Transcript_7954/g.29416 Transcript_7954/m.29416 type:complete len:228 (+) Transcript_7954:268-951(+)
MCMRDFKLNDGLGGAAVLAALKAETVQRQKNTVSQPPSPQKCREIRQHDLFNTVALPLIGSMAVVGLFGAIDPTTVTQAFLLYIVFDFLWVVSVPKCVPRGHKLIVIHHLATLGLVQHALRHPETAFFTCLDGLVELNTAFLVLRRQLPYGISHAFNVMYWITFFPLRFCLAPYLVYKFYYILLDYETWEFYVGLGCQIFLCCFNCVFLKLSLESSKRQKEKETKSS